MMTKSLEATTLVESISVYWESKLRGLKRSKTIIVGNYKMTRQMMKRIQRKT
jgi:hypothetical protein